MKTIPLQLAARGQRKARGLTLIEMAITMAVLAILASLALPSFGNRLARERLATTAEKLAALVNEARFDAARRDQALYVSTGVGAGACWSVATAADCNCETEQACHVHREPPHPQSGIRIVQAQALRLDPGGTALATRAAVFESPAGERLRLDVQAMGRTRICSLAGPTQAYPRC